MLSLGRKPYSMFLCSCLMFLCSYVLGQEHHKSCYILEQKRHKLCFLGADASYYHIVLGTSQKWNELWIVPYKYCSSAGVSEFYSLASLQSVVTEASYIHLVSPSYSELVGFPGARCSVLFLPNPGSATQTHLLYNIKVKR
jgi:hypothetical protein